MSSPLQFNDVPAHTNPESIPPMTNQQSGSNEHLSTETKTQLESLAYIRKMADDIHWMKQSQQRQIYVKYATYLIIAFITIWSIYTTMNIAKSFLPQYQKMSQLSDTLESVNVSKSGVTDILESFLK